MGYLYGRAMGYNSNEVKNIYRKLKNGEKINNIKICDFNGCRGGFVVNNLTDKLEECPRCKGYGFYRII